MWVSPTGPTSSASRRGLQSPECSPGGTITGTVTATAAHDAPRVILWWDLDGARGSTPAGSLVSPGSALRDSTGQVAVWRVPAFTTSPYGWDFNGGYSDVPVRLYVASTGVPWDDDGNPTPAYLAPVPGVELCTGVVEKQADSNGEILWNAPVRVTCDTTGTTTLDALASSDPTLSGHAPDAWVPMGLGVGVTHAPEQPGAYYLVAEPLTEPFRGGDAWRIISAAQPCGFARFEVGGGVFLDTDRRPILDEILLGEARDVYVQFSHPDSAATLSTTVRFVKAGVTQSSASIEATRVGGTSGGASLYEGLVHLVTPAGLKRGKILELGADCRRTGGCGGRNRGRD